MTLFLLSVCETAAQVARQWKVGGWEGVLLCSVRGRCTVAGGCEYYPVISDDARPAAEPRFSLWACAEHR